MIVRSMSPKEVADDARKDLRALVNKLNPIGKRMERELRIAPKGIDRIEQAIKWRSPRGNEWILVLIRSKRSTQMAGLVRYHGRDTRLRAVRVDLLGSDADIYFSAHFFERYLTDNASAPVEFMIWLTERYQREALRDAFHARSWADFLVDRILHRE